MIKLTFKEYLNTVNEYIAMTHELVAEHKYIEASNILRGIMELSTHVDIVSKNELTLATQIIEKAAESAKKLVIKHFDIELAMLESPSGPIQ